MQTEIRLVAEFVVKPDKLAEVRAILLAMIAPSVAEPGCRLYELHEDRENSNHLMFIERWADQAAVEFHRQTPHYKKLRPSLEGMLAEPVKLTMLRVIG